MNVTSKVKAILAISGKKQVDLAERLGMAKQSLNNKMNRGSWSAEDLVEVAELCGCRVAFVLPDGEHIFLEPKDENEKAPGE